MEFFDTHVHLTENDTDSEAYYKAALEARVDNLMICSSGLENTHKSMAFAEKLSNVYFSAGTHPHEAELSKSEKFDEFKIFTKSAKLRAIGEIGLDFYYDIADRNLQTDVFKGFLELALELDLPSIIHCRDKDGEFSAYDIMLPILEKYHADGGKYILHAFAGTPEYAAKFLDIGAFFGVGGMLTFKKADNIRNTVSVIPLEKIVLETDSPYLAPVPFRGKTNHPCYIPYIASALALLKNVAIENVAEVTTRTAKEIFNIRN